MLKRLSPAAVALVAALGLVASGGHVVAQNTVNGGNGVSNAAGITSRQVIAALGYMPLKPSNNLSDVASTSTALSNLGALSSTTAASTYAPIASPTFSGTQTLTTAKATTAAVGGCTIGSNAFCVTGATLLSGTTLHNLNTATAPAAISGATIQVTQADSTTNVVQMDSFGSSNQVIFRRAQGTNASPAATANGTTIGLWAARGYNGSAYTSAANAAAIGLLAAETWGSTNNGTAIQIQATPVGSVTPGEILYLTAAQAQYLRLTSLPAGGTTGSCFTFYAGPGICAGSGAPTLSAAQGSIYIRSDGSSTSTRLYVNTNGSTGWTNLTSGS